MIEEQMENATETLTRQISAYGMQPAQYMQMLGVTPEQFKERMRENSEKQVKASLALMKVAELEKIEITDKELEDEYKNIAGQYNMKIDELKEKVPRADVERDLKIKNAAKIIVANAIAEEFKEPADKESKKKPADKKASEKKPAASKKTTPKKTTDKKKNEEEI